MPLAYISHASTNPAWGTEEETKLTDTGPTKTVPGYFDQAIMKWAIGSRKKASFSRSRKLSVQQNSTPFNTSRRAQGDSPQSHTVKCPHQNLTAVP